MILCPMCVVFCLFALLWGSFVVFSRLPLCLFSFNLHVAPLHAFDTVVMTEHVCYPHSIPRLFVFCNQLYVHAPRYVCL